MAPALKQPKKPVDPRYDRCPLWGHSLPNCDVRVESAHPSISDIMLHHRERRNGPRTTVALRKTASPCAGHTHNLVGQYSISARIYARHVPVGQTRARRATCRRFTSAVGGRRSRRRCHPDTNRLCHSRYRSRVAQHYSPPNLWHRDRRIRLKYPNCRRSTS
jgi:hypothetical protein